MYTIVSVEVVLIKAKLWMCKSGDAKLVPYRPTPSVDRVPLPICTRREPGAEITSAGENVGPHYPSGLKTQYELEKQRNLPLTNHLYLRGL